MRQRSHSEHRLCAFNTTRGVCPWTQLEQLDCVLDMTCKYLYLHLCFQTRIILLVCTLVCSHNIGLPMYLSGKLASLLAPFGTRTPFSMTEPFRQLFISF